MRAQQQGVEGGCWGEGPGGEREAGLRTSGSPPPHTPSQRALLWDAYVQGRASALAHTCQSGRGRLPLGHLTPASPQFPLLVASFTGLVSPEGWGAIALCILEKTLGKGGDPTHPRPQSSVPSQLSPHGSFSPERGFRGAPASNLLQPQISRQPSQPKLSQHPHILGVQLTQDPVRTHRACAGGRVEARLGYSAPCACGHRTAETQRPFPEPLPHFALKQTHRHASRLWGFSLL